MNLVRDVLDAPLVNQNGQRLGRVDGIVLELRGSRPPRFIAMEVGTLTLARRIHPRLERWLRALALKVSPVPVKPVRISPETFRDIGTDIVIEVDPRLTARLLRVETWLRRHVIGKLPGGQAP
jgi:hypothetical protein